MQRKQTEASPAGVSARNPLQHIVSLNVCLMHFCDSSKSLHTCSPVSLSRPSWPSPVGRTPMLAQANANHLAPASDRVAMVKPSLDCVPLLAALSRLAGFCNLPFAHGRRSSSVALLRPIAPIFISDN